jgi:tetratricopeptide (TPR) repeat protein
MSTVKSKSVKTLSLSTAESRALLDRYRTDASAANRDRQRGTMSTSVSIKRQSASVVTIVLNQYEAAMQRKAYDEAIGCLLEVIRLGEARHDVFFNVAALLQHKGSNADAIEYFTKAIADDPLHPEDYLRRSECFAALSKPLEAHLELEKYFKLECATKALLVKCGKFALDADLLDVAEEYLQRALLTVTDEDDERAANDAYACFNLGELFERRGDDNEAQKQFARVCEIDPAFPDPYLAQANSEYQAGNYQMALHLYEAVAKITPDVPSIYVKLADVYAQLGEEFVGSVLSCLSRAIELTPPEEEAYCTTLVRRGVLRYECFDEFDEAIADLTLALEQNPVSSDALLHRAAVLRLRDQHGDTLQAVDDYRVAVSLDIPWTTKAEPYRFLANFELDEGNWALASRYFSLAAMWTPLGEVDRLNAIACFAHTTGQLGTSFEEKYEPRNYIIAKDDKARKAQEAQLALRGPPVAPLCYTLVDQAYTSIREQEPTLHTEAEYRVIDAWKAHREEVERARDDEAAKHKKGGKKK